MPASPVGLQQILEMQGLKWGQGAAEKHLWFENDTLYTDTSAISFVPGIVPNQPTFSNSGPLQDALTKAGSTAGHGVESEVVIPSPGTYWLDQPLYVPTWTEFKGIGTLGVELKAMPTFPTNTPMIYLGKNDGSPTFGCRVSRMTLHCNSVTGSIGIYSNSLNELCGARRVNVFWYMDKGIKIIADGTIIGGYNWLLEELNLNGASSAVGSYGIYVQAINEALGYGQIRRVTINPNGSPANQAAGIYLGGDADIAEIFAMIQDIHIEKHTDGVHFDAKSNGFAFGVTSSRGTTNAVTIDATRPVTVIGVRTTGGNCILDNIQSVTVPPYWSGYYSNVPASAQNTYLRPSAHVAVATAGTNAGSSAPAPILNGTDQHGEISFGTGTGSTAGAQIVHVAYSTAFNSQVTVTLTPASGGAAGLGLYAANGTGSGFDIGCLNAPTDGEPNDHYYVYYSVEAST